jgi:hypothetical protein
MAVATDPSTDVFSVDYCPGACPSAVHFSCRIATCDVSLMSSSFRGQQPKLGSSSTFTMSSSSGPVGTAADFFALKKKKKAFKFNANKVDASTVASTNVLVYGTTP